MPIGNGDIGLNVWVAANGDLNFYISKTDSWSELQGATGELLKLGQVTVSLNPSPLSGGAFSQVLKLRTGEIVVQEGSTTLRVWVDANHPVIRVEAMSSSPLSLSVAMNTWRTAASGSVSADTILTNQSNRIVWYHRNSASTDAHLRNNTFGAAILGTNLISQSATTLVSAAPATSQVVSIYPLTATTSTAANWLTQLNQNVTQGESLDLEQSRTAHQTWWTQFWNRSWIFVRGDTSAPTVTQGYALQRFITACGGRGAYPIKFNGSIFVVDDPTNSKTADYRTWGGQYWFQNTRLMYWPRLAAGDFEMMKPLFNMYAGQVAPNAAQISGFYGHGGSYFAETAPFWGGLQYAGPDATENFTLHYFTPILELSMMMLDYYDYTGDSAFVQQTLLPITKAGLQFFNEHFTRDADGKLLLDPDNSIETYWKVHDPAPDIAGLRAVLQRLLALPTALVDSTTRDSWTALQQQLPPLPLGPQGAGTVLLPYTGDQTAPRKNGENPELYAVFPFRLYGLGKPGYQTSLNTFNARQSTFQGGWSQDPMHSAMVGLADVAKSYVAFNFANKEPRLKFPAFWASQQDYTPNQCNGGNGEDGLQKMLMQADGRTILLCPAWPKGWDVDFKLNAPYQTTVEGSVVNGRVINLVVNPPERAADVIDMSALSATPPVATYNILSRQDAVVPLKQTLKGGGNVPAASGDFGGSDGNSDLVGNVRDGDPATKYFNKAQNGTKPPGVDSGFVITPKLGATVVSGFQIASAGDVLTRDPLTITIEGSNAANADQAGTSDFTLLYEGQCGLLFDSTRNAWGLYGSFANTTAYKSYRILVTSTTGGATSDAVQYSEVRLFGAPQTQPPGSNILASNDAITALKATTKGTPNVISTSPDFGSGQSASTLIDGNLSSKYFNTAQDGTYAKGVNTGFVITPAMGARTINGFQIAAGNDSPNRDPLMITIEGSNATDAGTSGGNGFVTLWEGVSGLSADPGRSTWGTRVSFWNTTAYRTYRVLVTQTRNNTDGAQYSEVRLFGDAPAPNAPSGFTGFASNGYTSLSWTSSAGNFRVKRATTSGGPYAVVASPTATSYTDPTVANGTTYYYVVSAVNESGESANSSQLTLTPQFSPASASTDNPPGQSAAMAFDGSTASKWFNKNGGNTGWLQYDFLSTPKLVTSYDLCSGNDVPGRDPKNWQLLGSNNGAVWTTLDTQTNQAFTNRTQTNSYTCTNTNAYRFYRLNIVANNGDASGIQLSELTFHFGASPPSAPASLTATTGNGDIRLSWQASSGATGYNIKRSTTTGGPYVSLTTTSGTTFTDATAALGTTYYYVVTAQSAAGGSVDSNEVIASRRYSFTGWRGKYFPGSETNDSVSGPLADVSGDGIPNLLKYAFNLDPRVANPASALPQISAAGPYLTITYRKRTDAPDLLYQAQVSGDLTTWSSSETAEVSTSAPDVSGVTTVVTRDTSPISSGRRFIRLKVTANSSP
jgi:hypothetical protein